MARRRGEQDVSKLPKWAQRRLQVLEENAQDAEARALHASTPGASNTCIHKYTGVPNDFIGLPPFSRIRFGSDDNWIEVRLIDPKRESKGVGEGEVVVEIYSGSSRLSVHPNVSNSISVKAEDR